MKLIRIKKSNKGVMGVLKDDKGGTYFTLENFSTIIPKGKYICVKNHSPKFGCELPLLYNDDCPASRGIRIHSGNTQDDSQGCVLVGNSANLATMSLTYSQDALRQLLRNMEQTTLEITDVND